MTPKDELAWLRRRGDPEVIEFLHAENRRTEEATRATAELERRLYREFRGRIQETDRSVPAPWGRYLYYYRTEEGKPYRIWARRDGEDGPEQVTLDENVLASGHEYCRVAAHAISPDHAYVAYTFDTSGDEDYSLVVTDLATGERLPGRIERTAEEIAWAADGRTLFYVTRDAMKRASRVYRHRLGFDPSEDALVLEEEDPAFHVSIRRARSGRFVFIETSSAVTRDTWILDAARPERPAMPLAERRRGIERDASDGGDALYIRTNEDAKNFRVLRVPLDDELGPAPRDRWKEVRPHRPDVMLERVEAFEAFFALIEREDGVRHLTIRRRDGSDDLRVDLEDDIRTVEVGENRAFGATRFRYVVSSPIRPPTTMELDVETGEIELLKVEPVPGLDPSRYVTERVWATAPDGTRVPISIVRRADVPPGDGHPCLLNGYGSYGICYEPAFSGPALSLVDRGVVFAIGHVRGGGELGESWHDAGKMLQKRNSFTDFIACAERLIELGYTSPDRLAIQGRSAGGLLMGAVVNLRPDLFRCVVAGVPFVDVLATMLDPSIPLTVIEYEEWGDPREPEYYDYIRSYSPFDNVREADYPDMLVTAGLNDPRVQYWEPARWAARLRERRTDDGLLLLQTDMGAGHMGPSDRFEWLRDRAFDYAFVLATLGVEEPRDPSGDDSDAGWPGDAGRTGAAGAAAIDGTPAG